MIAQHFKKFILLYKDKNFQVNLRIQDREKENQ